jgi:CHASE3 domain sensor protein
MKSLLCILFICILNFSSVEAILAPFEQSAVEIRAIIDSEELRNLLGPSQSVLAIEKKGRGYLITTSDYTLQIDLDYQYSGRIGPADFQLTFQKPVKKTD